MSLLTGHSVSQIHGSRKDQIIPEEPLAEQGGRKKPFPLPQDMQGQQLTGLSPEHPMAALIPVGPNAAPGSSPAGNDDLWHTRDA